jgi:hypothetical protein
MKIERSAPDRKGHDIVQYRCPAAAELSRCDCFVEVGMLRAEGEEMTSLTRIPVTPEVRLPRISRPQS